MLALCSPMLAVCGPRSALCWPYVGLSWSYVGLSWPYLGPILPLCWPYLGPMLPHHVDKFCRSMLKHLQHVIFSLPGPPPWTPKPRKTRGFLMAPRWNSGTPRATKHRETRRFLTPCAKNTVNYVGSGTGEVTPSWSAAGPARHYNLRLPTEGLRKDTGLVAGARTLPFEASAADRPGNDCYGMWVPNTVIGFLRADGKFWISISMNPGLSSQWKCKILAWIRPIQSQ